MDLFTGAGAFATIVGLLCNFKSERSGNDVNSFIEWLEEKHHESTARAIEHNANLSQQLSSILGTNHDELLKRLERLDQLISSVASQTPDFSGLVSAIHPSSELSDQAVSILRQLVNSGAKLFMEHKVMTGDLDEYILMEGGHGRIKYDEPQFIEDDLMKLVSSNLLKLEHGSKGSRRFVITRAATKLINEVDR